MAEKQEEKPQTSTTSNSDCSDTAALEASSTPYWDSPSGSGISQGISTDISSTSPQCLKDSSDISSLSAVPSTNRSDSGSDSGRIDQLNLVGMGLGDGDTGLVEEKLSSTKSREAVGSNKEPDTGQLSIEPVGKHLSGNLKAVEPIGVPNSADLTVIASSLGGAERMECEEPSRNTAASSGLSDPLIGEESEKITEVGNSVQGVTGGGSEDSNGSLLDDETDEITDGPSVTRSHVEENEITDGASPTRSHEEEEDELADIVREDVTDDGGKNGEVSAKVIDEELKELRDTWRPFHETRMRELGRSSRCADTEVFGRRASASVELARRLVRHCKLDEHEGCVNALHFNDDGTLLASGSDDLKVIVWDWISSRSRFSFNTGHNSNVFQCKFMPHMSDSHMVTCARDGQVRLALLSSTGLHGTTRRLAEHRGSAHKISLKSDSSHCLYTCGEDAVVLHIDLREDRPKKLCLVKEGSKRVELYSIHSNPFKSYEFCVGGRDQFVRIYDARKTSENGGGVLKKFCPQHMLNVNNARTKANVTCAVYNHDGTEVLGTYNDEDIYMFENKDMDSEVTKFSGHRNSATVKGVNFYGPRSEYVVSGSDCGHVFVWDKNSQRIINCFYADDGGVVNVLEPHPTAPILATSGLDSDVKIWMPLANEPVLLNGLPKLVNKNKREREREREQEPDGDSQMLWLLMQHLRRSARRQMRMRRAERNAEEGAVDDDEDDEEDEEDDDDTTSDDDDDEDDDEDDEVSDGSRAQCRQS